MLVQPQQAATVCEFDLVPHTIRSSKRAQTLDPNPPAGSSHEPLDLTLDLEYAHVRSLMIETSAPRYPTTMIGWSRSRGPSLSTSPASSDCTSAVRFLSV